MTVKEEAGRCNARIQKVRNTAHSRIRSDLNVASSDAYSVRGTADDLSDLPEVR